MNLPATFIVMRQAFTSTYPVAACSTEEGAEAEMSRLREQELASRAGRHGCRYYIETARTVKP